MKALVLNKVNINKMMILKSYISSYVNFIDHRV